MGEASGCARVRADAAGGVLKLKGCRGYRTLTDRARSLAAQAQAQAPGGDHSGELWL